MIKDYITKTTRLSPFAKKIILFYIWYVEKSTAFTFKIAIFLTHYFSKMPYYFIYILLSVAAICDNNYSSWWNLYIFYFTFSIFLLSAFLTIFYNEWAFAKIDNLVGSRFSEKYYKREKSGIFVNPFLLLGIACFTPFILDLLTLLIDQYEQFLRVDVLTEQMDQLNAHGKIKESKEIFEQIIVYSKTSSKGIITKLNIIIQSFVNK